MHISEIISLNIKLHFALPSFSQFKTHPVDPCTLISKAQAETNKSRNRAFWSLFNFKVIRWSIRQMFTEWIMRCCLLSSTSSMRAQCTFHLIKNRTSWAPATPTNTSMWLPPPLFFPRLKRLHWGSTLAYHIHVYEVFKHNLYPVDIPGAGHVFRKTTTLSFVGKTSQKLYNYVGKKQVTWAFGANRKHEMSDQFNDLSTQS